MTKSDRLGCDKSSSMACQTLPAPLKGNVTVATKSYTAAVREYAATAGKDGHFVAFGNPVAQADIARFLSQLASGSVPEVGP